MEKRTLLAVVLALLVFIFYPYYLKRFYPPKPQTQIAKEEVKVLSEPKKEEPVITSLPNDSEEEETIKTSLMEITFSSYEATIKNIKFLEYLDKNGKPIELSGLVPVSQRPMATSLPQNTVSYKMSKDGNSLVCTTATDNLKITKIYSVSPDSYTITANLKIENVSSKEITFPNYTVSIGTIFPGEEAQAEMYTSTTNLIDGKPVQTKLGKSGFRTAKPGKIFWGAVKNKYFTIVLKPQTPAVMATISDYELEKKRGICEQFSMPALAIQPHGIAEESFFIYAGPKKYEILKSLGSNIDQIMDLGMFAPISKGTLFLLNFFYKYIKNYGIAIILLTILVRIILYPLTLKSYKSMREMHKLQPHIQELQKKYKDDPKRMQKEMMLLYKEHKVNPFSGCLPMLLQMPILIALFTTLRSAIELRGAPFMLWIKDLSEPDTLLRLPNGLPINILPILVTGAMFLQQKMTSMPATSEQQAQQQKMMTFIMPIFMGFIFYNFPSGLNLYFGLSTILGVFDQYRIEKAKTA
jgi:YidC/Oxa1 family membrane protein insertase